MKLPKRTRRWLLIAAGVVLLYAVLGFFVAPPLLRSQIEKRASAALHRPVTLTKVRVNPFTLSLTLAGLRVADPDGPDLASWDRLYVNFDPTTSAWRREWHLGDVQLERPAQRFLIRPDGRLNIADLIPAAPASAETEPEAGLPAFGIGHLVIQNWTIDFTDQSRPHVFHTVAGPMSFNLRDLATRAGADSPYEFSGTTGAGEQFTWAGSVSLQPLASHGHVGFTGFLLPGFMPYAEAFLNGELRSGRLTLQSDYTVALDGGLSATLANTDLALEDVAVHAPGAPEPALAFQRFEVQMPQANVAARTAEIARVGLTGLRVQVGRRADGTLDLLDLLPPAAPTGPAGGGEVAPAPDAGPAPSVRVARVELADAAVTVTDVTTPRPARLQLDQIQVTAGNLGTDLDREITLDTTARWQEGGTVTTHGTVRLRPFAAHVEMTGQDLALAALENYLEPDLNVHIKSGQAGFAGTADASQASGEPLKFDWSGKLTVDNVATTDGVGDAELLGWKSLALSGVKFSLEPRVVHVDTIDLAAPQAAVRVAADGQLNLTAIRPAAAAASAPAPEAAPPPAATPASRSERLAAATQTTLPFAASIDAIQVADGEFSLFDASSTPAFATTLRGFSGSIRGLSSAELARADVDLRGTLDGTSPLRISGQVNPLAQDRYSDLRVTFTNISLPLFTPYTSRFLGRTVRQGSLDVDLAYRVSQRTLHGENRIVADQFYLGDRVPSPDAVKLPIDLALKLLRDRNGQIVLDPPVEGSLDDPEFRYGRIIWRVIGNIIVKAATSPFSIFGGHRGAGDSGDDLKFVAFASGATELTEAATGKIATLENGLFDHPEVLLEISAPAFPEADRAGLQQRKLEAQLLADRDPAATGTPAPEELDALVRARFARTFPDEAALAFPPAAEPAPAVAPAAERPPGFLQRVMRSVFGPGRPPAAESPPAPPATTETQEMPAPPSLTVAEMRARLLAAITLGDDDFSQLAAERVRVIRERLLADGRVEAERILVSADPAVPEGAAPPADGGRVYFGLQ